MKTKIEWRHDGRSLLSADQQQARARKAERLAAEKSVEKQKTRKFKVTPSKKKK